MKYFTKKPLVLEEIQNKDTFTKKIKIHILAQH